MKINNLNEMFKGWFVGNFTPTVLSTNDVEVAVKKYTKGDSEALHMHKVATEVTVVVSGRVRMNGVEYSENDIIVIEPHEATDFYAVDDVVTVVVKHPGVNDDKYFL